MKTCLILLSAGSGTRMGLNRNKVFFELSGKSVLRRSLEAFRDMVQEIILVHRPADEALILEPVTGTLPEAAYLKIRLYRPDGTRAERTVRYDGRRTRVSFSAGDAAL